jgi:hypothetical protein
MKFPFKSKFKKIFERIISTFRQKPLVSSLIIISTAIGIALVYRTDSDYHALEYFLTKMMVAIHLMIPLTVAFELSKSSLQKKKWMYPILLSLALVGVLTFVFTTFPWEFKDMENLIAYNAFTYKYLVVAILSVSSVLLLPYIGRFSKKDENDFLNKSMWGHVQQIFNGLASAFIFGLAVQIGLSIALGAIDALWGIDIDGWLYGAIGVFAFNFVSYMQLVGSIKSTEEAAIDKPLNKATRVFAKYILLPLTAIYTVILYPYIAKVLITGDWTPNMITGLTYAFLMLTYSTVYILFFDKTHFLRASLIRLLPALSIPVILIQIYGFWIRIDAYGFTVNRTELLIFALFALVLGLYFTISKKTKLLAIPIMFVSFALIATPISFALGKSSQIQRHVELLDTYGLVEDGVIAPSDEQMYLSYEKTNEIEEGVEYLLSYHGINTFEDILKSSEYKELESLNNGSSNYFLSSQYVSNLNINEKYSDFYSASRERYRYTMSEGHVYVNDLGLVINSIDSYRCYISCSIQIEEEDYELLFDIEDETYSLAKDLLADIYTYSDSADLLILNSLSGETRLLVFNIEILEEKDIEDDTSSEFSIDSLTGWIIR